MTWKTVSKIRCAKQFTYKVANFLVIDSIEPVFVYIQVNLCKYLPGLSKKIFTNPCGRLNYRQFLHSNNPHFQSKPKFKAVSLLIIIDL